MQRARWMKAISHFDRVSEIWGAIVLTKSWGKLTCAYLGLVNIDYPWMLVTRDNQKITLNNFYDLVTAWVVFCRKEYVVTPDAEVIVDLGANFGAFTLLAAQKAKQSRIISLEPFPAMFERLCENVESNGLLERVTCLPLAIAKESGERRMSLEDGVDQSRGILPEAAGETGKTIVVKTICLEELIKYVVEKMDADKIDIVKMDIEGGEHEWLPEIPASALQSIRVWQMEYHPNGSKDVLFKALERAGFNCVKDYIIGANSGVAHFERN